LALLGENLFRQGESEIALRLIREAIANLEADGAFDTSGRHGIRLALFAGSSKTRSKPGKPVPPRKGVGG
jgi:hypothetical protein